MRKIIDFLIRCYIAPLRYNSRLALYVKGKILTYDEHFLIAVDVMKRQLTGREGVIVDIGAYDGDSAIFFARHFPHHEILAFEPNPAPYNAGLTRIKNYPNIKLFNFGFSDTHGEANFFVANNSVSSSLLDLNANNEVFMESTQKVDVTTLDIFFENYKTILLMKLDIQGAELRILRSGLRTIEKVMMILTEVSVVEMYQSSCLYYQVDEFLRNHGFVLHSQISNYNNQGTKYFDILYVRSGLNS